MRRKSTRNSQKATPDKSAKEPQTPPKTRRSKRRKRSPSKSSDSEDEPIVKLAEQKQVVEEQAKETPDTTTKSTNSDEETSQEAVWKVTAAENAPRGEIQKLKICLTRPSESPEKTRSRRSKSNSQTEDDATTSSEDKTSTPSATRRTRSRGSPIVRTDVLSSQEADEDVEDKKGKGKSKGKHKSKIETSTHLIDPEIQTSNEISGNVQVTSQSPSIDKPVDNENDHNKVDVADLHCVNKSAANQGTIDEIQLVARSRDDDHHKSSDDELPLSAIKKVDSEEIHQSETKQHSNNAPNEADTKLQTSPNDTNQQSEQTEPEHQEAPSKNELEPKPLEEQPPRHKLKRFETDLHEPAQKSRDKLKRIEIEPHDVQKEADKPSRFKLKRFDTEPQEVKQKTREEAHKSREDAHKSREDAHKAREEAHKSRNERESHDAADKSTLEQREEVPHKARDKLRRDLPEPQIALRSRRDKHERVEIESNETTHKSRDKATLVEQEPSETVKLTRDKHERVDFKSKEAAPGEPEPHKAQPSREKHKRIEADLTTRLEKRRLVENEPKEVVQDLPESGDGRKSVELEPNHESNSVKSKVVETEQTTCEVLEKKNEEIVKSQIEEVKEEDHKTKSEESAPEKAVIKVSEHEGQNNQEPIDDALNFSTDAEMAEVDASIGKIDGEPKEDGKEEGASCSKALEENPKIVKIKSSRIKLKRDIVPITEEPKDDDEPAEDASEVKAHKRRRQWLGKKSSPPLVKINLETIQSVCPTIDFPDEPDLEIKKIRRKSSNDSLSTKIERKVSIEENTSDSVETPTFETQESIESTTAQDNEEKLNIIAFNRKISIVDDTASKLRPPPSPARNPTSDVLYVTNLVRPFTIKQLKELLERTGKIQADGFWTDRIKSKCYAHYENAEDAEATRNALHGVQWPIGNGKKLIIDYASVEDLENAKNPPPPPVVVLPVPEVKSPAKENVAPKELKPALDEKIRQIEKKRVDGPVREWDIGKKEMHRERSRSRERGRKHRRTPSPREDFISRKQKKAEEAQPQKLMDDLFLKTKAIPSIYWQPLSPEEIAMKQQQRLIRMEEHKRRMEENSRVRGGGGGGGGGGREMGRGAFRRRYD